MGQREPLKRLYRIEGEAVCDGPIEGQQQLVGTLAPSSGVLIGFSSGSRVIVI
jgi:hypothetical protein